MFILFAFAGRGQGIVAVTPIPIYYGGLQSWQDIDITGSGTPDYVLYCDGVLGSYIYPQGSNSIVIVPLTGGSDKPIGASLVAALSSGDQIGGNIAALNPTYTWFNLSVNTVGSTGLADQNSIGTVGYFTGLQTGYIGFDLIRTGQHYYGWMEVQNPFPVAAGSIVEWAYSTNANTPVIAGSGLLTYMAPARIVRPGNLRLKWQSQVGLEYQVQFTQQLSTPSWTNLDLAIVATSTNVAADVPIVGTTRFYRVVQVP